MARRFRLGDFFGITATQLVLYKPEEFPKLVGYMFPNQVRESLYSLIKELECLKSVLVLDNIQPDYEFLVGVFKDLGFMGFNNDTKDGKVKMKIAALYSDSLKMSPDELKDKYGEDTERMMSNIKSHTKTDIMKTFPGVSEAGKKIISVLYDSYNYINAMIELCKKRHNETGLSETVVSGRSVKDILLMDKGSNDSDRSQCCMYVNNMYRRFNSSRSNTAEKSRAMDELLNSIRSIQREYDAKDVVFARAEDVRDTLASVYDSMTQNRFMQITGITEEELTKSSPDGRGTIDTLFKQMDDYLIGGLGFNSREFGESSLTSLESSKSSSWSVEEKERNDKLDYVLRMAYVDLQSKKYMESQSNKV